MSNSTFPSLDLSGRVQKADDNPVAHGGYSDIYRGLLTPSSPGSPIHVAIKVIVVRFPNIENDRRIERRLNRELATWKDLAHPGVAELFGVSYSFGRLPALISLWYHNGNARDYLVAHPDANRLQLLRQVVAALEYLHGLNPAVVHGDIKATNVFIKDNGEACLGDFGLARFIQEDSTGHTTTTPSGTWRWMAPELLFSSSDEPIPVTKQSDIYALGCLAMEISTGQFPWYNLKNDFEVMMKVHRGVTSPRPEGDLAARELEDGLWALIESCWRYESSQRPPIATVQNELLSIMERRRLRSLGTLPRVLEDNPTLTLSPELGETRSLPSGESVDGVESIPEIVLPESLTSHTITPTISPLGQVAPGRSVPNASPSGLPQAAGVASEALEETDDLSIAESVAKLKKSLRQLRRANVLVPTSSSVSSSVPEQATPAPTDPQGAVPIAQIWDDVHDLYHGQVLPDFRRTVVPNVERIFRQLKF